MKNINTPLIHLKILFTLLITFSILSCNLIISNVSSRINPNDPEAQISNFNAIAIGSDTVLTTWQWNDYNNNNDDDERIQEIVILHSVLNYPQVLVPFTGESFTNGESGTFEWKDLDKNSTHYFALHMMDGNQRWYSPIYAKTKLPGGDFVTSPASILTAWQVDRSMTTVNDPPGFPVWMTDNQAIVLNLNLPVDIFVVSAFINPANLFGIHTDNGSDLTVFSLTQSFDDLAPTLAVEQLFDEGSSEYIVDTSSLCEVPGQNNLWNSTPIDITNAVQNAVLSGSNQIILKMMISSDTAFLDLEYTDFIEIEYIEN